MPAKRVLHTVAFPSLASDAVALLEGMRWTHDRGGNATIALHFTLVFACDGVPLATYLQHVEAVAAASRPIAFSCRHAMPYPVAGNMAFVYLVPDEGLSALAMLHARLYTGPLAPHLRLDLPFIPHITLGSGMRPADAKAVCDDLNRRDLDIAGRVEALTIGTVADGRLVDLARCALRK